MKILHISKKDIVGGAAIAAHRLHTDLLYLGFDSLLFTARKEALDPRVITYWPNSTFSARIKRAVRNKRITRDFSKYKTSRPAGAEIFSDDRSRFGREIVEQLPECDIINLHWISGFIDYKTFFGSTARYLPPIVWTLHDMNAFTGGCHYDFGCEKYKHGCGACPQLGSNDPDDLSHRTWVRKKKIFDQLSRKDLHVVAPSNWLAGKAAESRLLKRFKVSIIRNGLNTEDFAPRDKHHAREALGIPTDANTIVFIAQSVQNKRKGFELLQTALGEGEDIENLFLVTIGKNKSALNLNIPTLQIGYLESDRLLSLIYSAADLFVIPSLQDNFPNTVLESLACGTPVVGFDSSGISEMVQSSQTGILTPAGDIVKLRAAIADLLSNKLKRNKMALNCRSTALKLYAPGTQARNYENLYESIIRNRNS